MPGEPAKTSPARCPLCGEPNACALAAGDSRPCWCASETFPDARLARVPADQTRRACICRSCLEAHRLCPLITDSALAWESHQFKPGDNNASLSPAAVRELSQFAKDASPSYDERGCGLPEFRRAALGLRTLRDEIAKIEDRSLRGGPGFVLIQGPEPASLSLPELKLALAALSCQLGPLVAQNGRGDMVKEVKDRGLNYGENKTSRYSDTRFGGNYHTDGAEVPTPIRYFPFYCLSPAVKGGITQVVSAYSVHNRLLAEDPDNLERLYRPFRWDRRGDLGPKGEKSFEKPVFRYENGKLRCDYLRTYIEEGYSVEGLDVPDDVARALDAMDRCIYDDTLCLDAPLKAGQIYVANNFFTIHGRSDFEDDPKKPRLFLRTWVEA